MLPAKRLGGLVSMETFFARHTDAPDINKETRYKLWQDRRIAIHFPHGKDGKLRARDNRSLKLSDYPSSARRAMHALLTLAKKGGYVCAEHHAHQECLLGYVR